MERVRCLSFCANALLLVDFHINNWLGVELFAKKEDSEIRHSEIATRETGTTRNSMRLFIYSLLPRWSVLSPNAVLERSLVHPRYALARSWEATKVFRRQVRLPRNIVDERVYLRVLYVQLSSLTLACSGDWQSFGEHMNYTKGVEIGTLTTKL